MRRSTSVHLPAVVCIAALAGCTKEEAPPPPADVSYAAADYTRVEADDASFPIRFTDVTQAAGIGFSHETGAFGGKWMPETMGSGGGFLDYDNDGDPDLLLVNCCYWPAQDKSNTRPTLALYRNRGDGTFEDVTAAAGLDLALYGMGCAFGDYDGDGDPDIYVTAVGPNVLLRNDDGRFTDVTAEANVTGDAPGAAEPSWSTSAAWLDFDRDSRIDLFVCNYVKWTPETDIFTTMDGKNKSYATPQQYPGQSCRLYRNLDGRRFEDVTERAGVLNDQGKSMGVAIADFNDDGWPEILVSNDTQPNFLYFNRGDGTFIDNAIMAGLGMDESGRARAGMGIDVADVANTGRSSVVIGNFSREPLSLYTQLSEQFFQDQAGRARLTRPTLLPLTFGLLFADFDNDGYVDLAVANGHIEPEINSVQRDVTFAQSPQLFRNDGNGTFIDVSDQAGDPFRNPVVGRGMASADIDRDGDLDLLITTNGGRPLLLRNDLPADAPRAVFIRLRGAGFNTNALGAGLKATTGNVVQQRMVRTGSSYLSQSDTIVAFGTGTHGKIDKLEVRWPAEAEGPQQVDTHHDLRPGKVRTITQPSPTLAAN